MSFGDQLLKFAKKTNETQERVVRGTKIALFKDVVGDTPVDTGRLIGNWQATIGAPANGTIEDVRSEDVVIGEVERNTGTSKDTAFLTNNLDYAAVVEYGGYPVPPKKGSYDKEQKKYVIKSAGGYSKKSPEGMVQKNVARFQRILKAQVRKHKK